jgi:RNase P subunit RPR2
MFSCHKCGWNKESLRLGRGMAYSRSRVFYGGQGKSNPPMIAMDSLIKNPKIRKEALTLLEHGGVPTDDYGHSVYGCPECKRLHPGFYFRIKTESGIYEPGYKCAKCGHILIRLKIHEGEPRQYIRWNCPSCGNSRLYLKLMTFWD